jgi:hypothetical protein
MTLSAPLPRIRRMLVIHLVVQLFLLGLLLYMAFHFQALFRAKGMPQVFLNSIIASLVLELLAFYPVNRFAAAEARREIAAEAGTLSPDGRQGLRHQRLFSDFGKATAFLAFAVFIALAPPATFVMSTAFFGFIFIILTYLQCFDYAARRTMKG